VSEQGLTSPPTQYRLSGRQFYRSKDPPNSIKVLKEHKNTQKHNKRTHTHKKTENPLVYTNTAGWLGDGSHRGQGCQAWTAVKLPPWYPS